MKLEFDTFRGEIPKLADHRLPMPYAKDATNCKIGKGNLRAFQALLRDSALSLTTVETLYLHTENSNEHWIESLTRHYVKSPISGDAYERAYYTDGTQPYFFANDNISGGGFDATADKYKLGIPQPTTAPTVGSPGGGATYRAYVYAYVNSYGEEGPPSAIDSITDYDTGYVTIDDIVAAPASRAIDKIYLYRTNASGTGSAEFQFVLEATWFSATVSYVVGDYVIYSTDLYKCTTNHSAAAWDAGHFTQGENVADANLLAVYPKTNFDPPPATLKGLTALANGALAGFVGNQLYLSEPYYPHAWPTDYIIAFDADIVGIAANKNTITIATSGYPYLVYGTHPSTMSKTKMFTLWPAFSSRSVIPGNDGAFFLTRDGLIFSAGGTMINITQTAGIMDPEDWAGYVLASCHMYWFEKKLFIFDHGRRTGFFIDFSNPNELQYISLGEYFHAGIVTDEGYFYVVADDIDLVDENDPPANMPLAVKRWEGDTLGKLYYRWESQELFLTQKTNFSACKVILDQAFYDIVDGLEDTSDIEDLNAAIFAAGLTGALCVNGNAPLCGGHELCGDEMLTSSTVSLSGDVDFRLYADGELKFTKTLSSAYNLFRLPAGYVSDAIYIRLTGHATVKKVVLATSFDEMI